MQKFAEFNDIYNFIILFSAILKYYKIKGMWEIEIDQKYLFTMQILFNAFEHTTSFYRHLICLIFFEKIIIVNILDKVYILCFIQKN